MRGGFAVATLIHQRPDIVKLAEHQDCFTVPLNRYFTRVRPSVRAPGDPTRPPDVKGATATSSTASGPTAFPPASATSPAGGAAAEGLYLSLPFAMLIGAAALITGSVRRGGNACWLSPLSLVTSSRFRRCHMALGARRGGQAQRPCRAWNARHVRGIAARSGVRRRPAEFQFVEAPWSGATSDTTWASTASPAVRDPHHRADAALHHRQLGGDPDAR